MKTGKVKWFNSKKGFGFIEQGGVDYFVHHKSIVMDGFRNLTEGQEVKFNHEQGEKEPIARDVEVIS